MSDERPGVVVIDKPAGITSHDAVARARKLLGTRRVGHAGTLDPMATGVLVLLVGEATKLANYLTAHDKRYEARVLFGIATDTLDREGATTARAEVPGWLLVELAAPPRQRLAEAVAAERARTQQIPPAFSAIHVGGRRSYEEARKGNVVDLAPRPVEVREIDVLGAAVPAEEAPYVDLGLAVSKGYYVRSLARDLGERLGVPACLGALRRTASGPFTIADACPLDRDALHEGLVSLDSVARAALPVGRLSDEGAQKARRGQRMGIADFTEPPPAGGEASAWIDPEGRLVAVGTREASDPAAGEPADRFVIHRGFAP